MEIDRGRVREGKREKRNEVIINKEVFFFCLYMILNFL